MHPTKVPVLVHIRPYWSMYRCMTYAWLCPRRHCRKHSISPMNDNNKEGLQTSYHLWSDSSSKSSIEASSSSVRASSSTRRLARFFDGGLLAMAFPLSFPQLSTCQGSLRCFEHCSLVDRLWPPTSWGELSSELPRGRRGSSVHFGGSLF